MLRITPYLFLCLITLAEAKPVSSLSSAVQICMQSLQPSTLRKLTVSANPYKIKNTSSYYNFYLNAKSPAGIWECTVDKSNGKVTVKSAY